MVPHSREARQAQRFSMSRSLLMTRPARNEVEPSCTTPLRTGRRPVRAEHAITGNEAARLLHGVPAGEFREEFIVERDVLMLAKC